MTKRVTIPKKCGLCEYLKDLPSPDNATALYACSHKGSFDDEATPGFVMPSEEPPDFCALRQLLADWEKKQEQKKNLGGFQAFIQRFFPTSPKRPIIANIPDLDLDAKKNSPGKDARGVK